MAEYGNDLSTIITLCYAGVTRIDAQDFRDHPVPDGTLFQLLSNSKEYRYRAADGAGFADDNNTILKPTAIAVSAPGRAYSTEATEYAASFAHLRAMRGVLGRVNCVHVACHTTMAAGGGGDFDIYPKGAFVEDYGWTVIVDDFAAIRRGTSATEVWVRDFGAIGNDVVIDDVAIARAHAKISSGGVLHFTGKYPISAPVPLLSGQTFQGTDGSFRGSCFLRNVTIGSSCITIGERVFGAGVRNIGLTSDGLGYALGSSYGIKMEGSYPNSTQTLVFDHVYGWQLGMFVDTNSLSVSQWQCDNVRFCLCACQECGGAVHLNSQNNSLWKFDNCGFSTALLNGVIVDLERSGPIEMSSCQSGGFQNTGTFIRGKIQGSILLNNVQAENITNYIETVGPSCISITMNECVADGQIVLHTATRLNLIGGNTASNIVADAGARIYNYDCYVAGYTLTNGSMVVVEHLDAVSKKYISEKNPTGFPVESTAGGVLLPFGLTDVLTAYSYPDGNYTVHSYFVCTAPAGVQVEIVADSVEGGGSTIIMPFVAYGIGRHLIPSYTVPLKRGTGTGGYIVLRVATDTANAVRVFGSIDCVAGTFR